MNKPQHKAAAVSGRNRSQRAQDRRDRERRRAELVAEHDRGEHTSEPYNISCAKCYVLWKSEAFLHQPAVTFEGDDLP